MAPHDSALFTPTVSVDWLATDDAWFDRLTRIDAFTLPEKMHLIRVALQLQWICDIKDDVAAREAIADLGLHVAIEQDGFLIVTGSGTFAEYLDFRSERLSLVETGVFYGYPPSAVLAHTGVIPAEKHQVWPTTTAQYFLGGVYSEEFAVQERQALNDQWSVIKTYAPKLADAAEQYFANSG